MRISETDLNVLAQVFYENKGPEVVLRSMSAKEDVVSGLRGVFEALGFEVVEGEKVALEIRVPGLQIVSRLGDQVFDVEDYRGDLERRITNARILASKYERIFDADSEDRHAQLSMTRVTGKAQGLEIARDLLPKP